MPTKNSMIYASLPGVKPQVSRLVLGCDSQWSTEQAFELYDAFFEQGGNAFDTAHVYGGGKPETFVGEWMKARKNRAELALIVKGAHTPYCTPEFLHSNFKESLERLQTDYAHIYLMHRDNLDVPVGEFVHAMNEYHRAGKIGIFGGSNWSLARMKEANAYADKKGLQRLACLSNNYSLAEMVDPIWPGCSSASYPEYRQWLIDTQTVVFAWSSQSRGFFTDRAGRDKLGNEDMVRCWYSEKNFKRRERAMELAEKKGVRAMNIALAYVLHQSFPAFAIIGVPKLEQLGSSIPGLSVSLTPDELRWLNLE